MMNKYRNGLEQNQRDRRQTLGVLCGEFALCVEVLDKARATRAYKAAERAGGYRWPTLPDDRVRHHPAPVVNTNRCVVVPIVELCGAAFAHGGTCIKPKGHDWGCSDRPCRHLINLAADGVLRCSKCTQTAKDLGISATSAEGHS